MEQEEVAENLTLAVVSEKNSRKEAAVSESAMEVWGVATEVVVPTSSKTMSTKIRPDWKHWRSRWPR